MKRILVAGICIVFLGIFSFVSANTLTQRLDGYIQTINQMEAEQQHKILTALQNIQRTSSKKVLKSLVTYIVQRIEISNPNTAKIPYFYGEKSIELHDTILIEKEQKRNELCTQSANDEEKRECFEYIEKIYTKSKQQACILQDGPSAYSLEALRPGKKVRVPSFVKDGNTLTYPVYTIEENATDWFPSCEAESFQWSLFSYDCVEKKSYELYSSELDHTTRMGACGIQVYAENDVYVIYMRFPYEWHCGMYEGLSVLNKKTGKSSNLQIFEEKETVGSAGYQIWNAMQTVASKHTTVGECFGPSIVGVTFLDQTDIMINFRLARVDNQEIQYTVPYDIDTKQLILQ